MAVRLYAMTCGWITMSLGSMLEGEKGRITVPIPSYLIDHPKGKVLFDSGMHLDSQRDVEGYLGAMARSFALQFGPGEEVSARLTLLDLDPREIRFVVNSHLHFDHAGGNAQLPDARLVVQRPEWEAAHEPDLIERIGYLPKDYDTGQDVLQVAGEHDLFGDGTVVCVPTYGHTPGHQSLRVRLEAGEVVLTGDACYLRRTLENLHLPRILHDREEMIASLKTLRALEARGARIFYGHDPEFWRDIPQAPLAVG